MEIILKETGQILGLRETGSRLRKLLETGLANNEIILIDFEGVESISSSFADEFIAKSFMKVGKEKFSEYVKIKNANDFVRVIINSSLSERLKRK